jgi:hypothetical protein
MQSWADAHAVSYIAWEWTETQAYGTGQTENYLAVYASDGQTILPIQGAGTTFYNWLASH